MPIVDETGDPIFIDGDLGGHAPKLEEVYFLPVALQDRVAGVGQANEWQGIGFPVQRKCQTVFRSNHQDHGVLFCEFVVILAQLRHVPSAEGSEKAAIENEQDVLLQVKICEADLIAVEIGQCEIGGGFVEFSTTHTGTTRITPKMISTTRLMMLDWVTDLSTHMETPRTTPTTR